MNGFNAQPHHRRNSAHANVRAATYCIEGETLTVAAIAERLATDRQRVSTALTIARKREVP